MTTKIRPESVAARLPRRFSKRAGLVLAFMCLASILAGLRVGLLITSRVPMGHDSFQYLQLQYLFFNEAALTGWLPYWLPFMTHGQISNVWFLSSQGILASSFYLLAPALISVNYLELYQIGLLFDEVVLLLGCVLLARRYYHSSTTVLFVSASIVFSALSVTQIWWDFHIFYLFPLILHCLHMFFDRGSSRYLFFAGALGSATLLGNLPYFIPITLAFFTVYWVSIAACIGNPFLRLGDLWHEARGRLLLAAFAPVPLALGVAVWLLYGSDEIVHSNVGRSGSGEVASVGEFLSYGGHVGYIKYLETVARVSNSIDVTLYAGLLVIPFACVSLVFVRSRMSYVVGVTALVFASLALGSYLTLAYFYVFPLAKYFRHIGALAVISIPFFVMYAGFGFQAFYEAVTRSSAEGNYRRLLQVPLAVLFALAVLICLELAGVLHVFDYSTDSSTPLRNYLYLDRANISAGLGLSLVILGLAIAVMLRAAESKGTLVVWLLLGVHLLDLVSYKAEREFLQAAGIPESVKNLFDVSPYDYSPLRTQAYFENTRFRVLAPYILPTERLDTHVPLPTLGSHGALYWNTESMLFFDAQASIFRNDFQLRGVELFYRNWVNPADRASPRHFGFPIPASTAYRRLSGYEYPKLQVFSRLRVLPTESDVFHALRSPTFGGGSLFAATDDVERMTSGAVVLRETADPTEEERLLDAAIDVEHFSFNTLRVRVDTRHPTPSVLYYADAWHPFWRARVNGTRVPVIRTNIGYKSVEIPPGESVIEFQFGNVFHDVLIASCLGLGLLTSLIAVILARDLWTGEGSL